jgi:sugar/nucleoside kinase (ribokinase family)
MAPTNSVDLMMIGHFAIDRNVIDGQGATVAGGAVYFGSMAARQLGVTVAVVTRLRLEDFSYLEELKKAGVTVFAAPAPETSGIENIYDSANMERRICHPLGFAGGILLADLPDLPARIYAVTPIMAGEVDLELLQTLAHRGPVALDIQGFVRVRLGGKLIYEPWPDLEEGLSHVTYLKVDVTEAELLTGMADLAAAAHKLAGFGPREIVLTESAGVTVFADGQLYQAPFNSRSLVGRTGRGDTCFATYLSKRLSTSPAEATRWAGAVTTLKQEQSGPWRGPLDEIEFDFDPSLIKR